MGSKLLRTTLFNSNWEGSDNQRLTDLSQLRPASSWQNRVVWSPIAWTPVIQPCQIFGTHEPYGRPHTSITRTITRHCSWSRRRACLHAGQASSIHRTVTQRQGRLMTNILRCCNIWCCQQPRHLSQRSIQLASATTLFGSLHVGPASVLPGNRSHEIHGQDTLWSQRLHISPFLSGSCY